MTQWALLLWLWVCAVCDARTRNVPNWLTIPVVALAILGAAQSFAGLAVFIAIALIALWGWQRGLLGGADAKILMVLAGLWPEGCAWAATGVALDNADRWIAGKRGEHPIVPAMALGVATLLAGRYVCAFRQ